MKKSIIALIGVIVIIVALGLYYSVFNLPDGAEKIQQSTVSDNNTTNGSPESIPDETIQPIPQANNITEPDTSDWKTYRNDKYGFEIKYPEDWTNENRESVVLFSQNGPVGDDFGFLAVEKNKSGNPFWISIYLIPNIKNYGELEYFDFAHKGDVVLYDGYDIVKIGDSQEEFLKVNEKSGYYNAYIKIRNQNYFEISYFNPKVDSLNRDTEQMISTFKFIDDDNASDFDTSYWNTYRNEKYGYEMKYPKEWIIETYDGKYTGIKKDQINADWIQFALHTKDEQKIKNYGESMIANVDVSVDTKYIAIEDYLKDFGYGLNENTLKEGYILSTRGIAKVWMKIREGEFKGQKAYVIEYSDSGYYLYFKNQNIYKISSLWNINEINKKNILDIINTFKFIN